MGFGKDFKDVTHVTTLGIWALVICLIAGGAFYFGWLKYGKKASLDLKRQAIKHSIQYTESLRAEVNVLVTSYNKAKTDYTKYKAANEDGKYDQVISNLKIQIRSIRNQIKDRISHMPDSEIPSNVRLIISGG